MIRWLRQTWAIAKNAFVITLSDPVYLVITLSVLTVMAVFTCLPSYNFGEGLRLVRDQSLALIFIGGCIVGVAGAATVITRDLKQGAVSVLMSRPVSSTSFVFGKWIGVAGAIGMYHLTATLACLWVTKISSAGWSEDQRIDELALGIYAGVIVLALLVMALKHYFFGGWYVWQAAAALCVAFIVGFLIVYFMPSFQVDHGDGHYIPEGVVDWPTSQACLLLFFAELIFSAILIPIAIKVDIVMVLTSGMSIFFLGLLSESVLNLIFGTSPGFMSSTVRAIVPNWQQFWITDLLDSKDYWLAPSYLLGIFTHTALYAAVCLVIGTLTFNRREFAGNDLV